MVGGTLLRNGNGNVVGGYFAEEWERGRGYFAEKREECDHSINN